jgi:hypothetical protein
VLAALTLAIGGVLWMGDRAGARIKGTSPAALSAISAYSSIGIEFAQAMQVATVEAALTLEPPISGTFRWEGQTFWFTPLPPFQRGLTYTARLAAGSLSLGGQSVKQDVVWQFTVRDPWIAFIAPINQDREVWRVRPDGTEAQQLTQTGGAVYDLAVSRDGEHIAYSVLNTQRGLDLWLMGGWRQPRQAVECGFDQCTVPAFARRRPTGLQPRKRACLARPRLPAPDFRSDHRRNRPSIKTRRWVGIGWSPDGRRIAVLDLGQLRVYNLRTMECCCQRRWG